MKDEKLLPVPPAGTEKKPTMAVARRRCGVLPLCASAPWREVSAAALALGMLSQIKMYFTRLNQIEPQLRKNFPGALFPQFFLMLRV
jgi:hypothetical protein